MSYFGFLALFLGGPLLVLLLLTWRDRRQGRLLTDRLANWTPQTTIIAHIVVAVLYTTPWDNYLVATRVWWYDPALVTGIVLGWVPLEEYIFFILQTLLSGLWLLFLARRLAPAQDLPADNLPLRRAATLVAFLIWLGAAAILWVGWRPGTYLGLELIWAMIPMMIQLAFGADIIWHYRRVVLLTTLSTTLYLSAADAVAIGSGTWTIDPAQSLQIYLGRILPIEEFVFFLVTNVMVTFGMVLVLARHSQTRLETLLARYAVRLTPGRKGSR